MTNELAAKVEALSGKLTDYERIIVEQLDERYQPLSLALSGTSLKALFARFPSGALRDEGIAESIYPGTQSLHWRLTPLGIQVREFLKGQP